MSLYSTALNEQLDCLLRCTDVHLAQDHIVTIEFYDTEKLLLQSSTILTIVSDLICAVRSLGFDPKTGVPTLTQVISSVIVGIVG